MTSYVERGVDQSALNKIAGLTALLVALYLAKILFRYLSNYLAHKAAWNLVEEMRIRVYRHIQSFSMSFFLSLIHI